MTTVNELTSKALKDLLANKFTKNIGELDDVDTTTTPPATNQVLTYDGAQWEPGNVPRSANDLSDVDTTGVTNGQVLVFDSASAQFKPGSQAQALKDLTDVDTATVAPSEGQLLTFQSTIWKPTSKAEIPQLGFWNDVSPGANIWKIGDRLLIGDAINQNGNQSPGTNKSWVGFSANGHMTYFDSRSQAEIISTIGGVAIAAASRSSDNTLTGEKNTIGVASYVNNDNTNTSDKKSAWAFYGHAVQTQQNAFTTGIELDVCDVSGGTLVSTNPYAIGAIGATATAWIGVGGETVQSGTAATAFVSTAIGIITSASSDPNSKFEKGIVFDCRAIAGTDGTTGTGVAMELAKGHEIVWRYSAGANAYGGKIRSDCNSASNQTRLVFGVAGLLVKGVQSDLVTETTLFKVTPGSSVVNFLELLPSATGTGITLLASGTDTNIDVKIQPKGSGVIDYIKSATAATTPANFTASYYLPIKANGTTYYIPVRNTTW